MLQNKNNSLWAIVLAGGKGKRMKAKEKNKVTYEVSGKPMILRTIDLLSKAEINNIVVVVGFAKESVLKILPKNITTVFQSKRLGTGHAVRLALKKILEAQDVLVLNGDDSFLYSPSVIKKLYETHKKERSKITFVTIEVEDPSGLGRILRNGGNKVNGIIEEKDATEEQKKIKEINAACYLFSYGFLKKYIKSIQKSKVTGEYYITNLIHEAVKNDEKIETLVLRNFKWRGVNTMEELKEAEEMIA